MSKLHVWFRSTIVRLRIKLGIFCSHACPLAYDRATILQKAFQTYKWSIFFMTVEENQMLNREVKKHLKKSQKLILNEYLQYTKL